MKVRVTLLRTDRETGEETILADGIGLQKGRQITYFEKDTKIKHVLEADEVSMKVSRYGDVTTHTCLHKSDPCITRVESGYGTFEIELKLIRYKNEGEKITAEYHVMSGNETASRIRMVWMIRAVS